SEASYDPRMLIQRIAPFALLPFLLFPACGGSSSPSLQCSGACACSGSTCTCQSGGTCSLGPGGDAGADGGTAPPSGVTYHCDSKNNCNVDCGTGCNTTCEGQSQCGGSCGSDCTSACGGGSDCTLTTGDNGK